MKKPFLLFGLILFSICIKAQSAYNSHAQLTTRLQALASKNGTTASVKSIGKSKGGKDIWLLSLSIGDASKKPALLVVGGADGSYLAGTEIVIQMAEKLLASSQDSIAKLLQSKTLYLIPTINPDAQEQFSSKLKFERSGNTTETDDDRDGKNGEDPAEDLNQDGIITQIRIEDPSGMFVPSKDDPRIMVKADPAKGEAGKYLVYSEGTDNDKDGEFNEDGMGGVNIDKNFTFDYPIFEKGSGEFAASESETRAFLDFLYLNRNIFAVINFGLANNLSDAPKFDRAKTTKRIVSGLLEKDAATNDQVSKLYNIKTGLKDAPAMPMTKGNLAQTAYYHAGRFAFTTPGWWVPKVQAPKDTTKKEAPKPPTPAGPAGNMPENDEVKYLKWADSQKLSGVFIDWKTISHTDFADKKVEVGGIVPFSKLNPPINFLNNASDKHLNFLVNLGYQMPEIQIINTKVEALQGGVNRITLQIVNKGLLPTYAEIGDRTRWVQKVKTEVKTGANQTIISGRKINLRNTMAAGEMVEYSWLITGSGKISIEAGCPTAGTKTMDFNLK